MEELNKNNPFKTPEGYLENFQDRLLDKLNKEKLSLPKEEGFVVPEDYFDGLHENIQKKLDDEVTKVVQLYPYKKFYWTAASIAAILLAVFGINRSNPDQLTFDDLASADIEIYFEENELELTSFEIAEVIAIEEVQINDLLEDQIEETEVLDYLDENIDDIEDLNLEDYE